MAILLDMAVTYALACIVLAMLFCTVRLLIGPAAHDRVLALDSLWMCCIVLALVLGLRFESLIYFEAAMVIALIGFVSTIALTKFLMRGEIIE